MTIKQLTYFIAVAKYKNFTSAANELYITQSALSKTIQNMERELDHQLIDRTSRKFKLTTEGKLLYEKGTVALKHMQDLMEELHDCLTMESGRISVGVPPVIGTIYFTEMIQRFRATYPNISLNLLEEGANSVKHRVEEGEIDIGVVILPFSSGGFKIMPAFSSDCSLIVHKSHPLAQREAVKFSELKEETFISLGKTFMLYDRIKDLCRSVGFEPNIAIESSQWDFVAEMVSLNQGVSILPRPILSRFHSQNIRILTLKEPEFPWNIAMIIKEDKYISNAMKSFIKFVENEAKQLDKNSK